MAACRMSEIFHHHTPVLLRETVEQLVLSPEGVYVDATFGRGSHSQAILDRLNNQGRLIAFDKDLDAVAYAEQHFSHDPRFKIFHASFASLQNILKAENVFGAVDGILFDLGVSSPQLDDPTRGFSFMHDGKLDMRMDQSQAVNAMTWLANISEKELATVLWQYGEEKFSRRIARAIVAAREAKPITTTFQLVEIISQALPKKVTSVWEKHPATRSFQAIRIAVNQELTELERGLTEALAALRIGGRFAVISFHSLEDRIVKQFIRLYEKGQELPHGLPIKGNYFKARLKTIGKPLKPDSREVNVNPRARSAILRIAEKIL